MRATLGAVVVMVIAASVPAQELARVIHSITPRPFTEAETRNGLAKSAQLFGDRFEYWSDDRYGQFYLVLPEPADGTATQVRIEVLREGHPVETTTQPAGPKSHVLVRMDALAAGSYELRACRVDDAGEPVGEVKTFGFERVNRQRDAIAFPKDGLPLSLMTPDGVSDASWPTRASVPLPVNLLDSVDRLALEEDGRPIAADLYARNTWGPRGSAQWVHVDFAGRYQGGKPASYRLKLLDEPAPPPTSTLKCTQNDDRIVVDNGTVKFVVDRKGFRGISTAWFDPTGSGNYRDDAPVITDSVGPYLVDGRIIRFEALDDESARVEVEEQGATRVTIVAEGWYVNEEKRVDPLCRFQTRISAYAGSPIVRISHHTIITYDTRLYRLADVGFHFGLPGATAFATGIDGNAIAGALPGPSRDGVFLHQDRHDRVRLVGADEKGQEIVGQRSDGWFAVTADSTRVSMIVRDLWQKFPKEIDYVGGGLTAHFWPRHGRRAFTLEEELSLDEIYKFWCFHQHGLLDLELPGDYFDRLKTYPGTMENVPQHALNGNGQGLVIGNEMALVFEPADADPEAPARWAHLFDVDPIATAPAEWNADTGAMGAIAARDDERFGWVEEAVEKAYLSYTKSVERGGNYGMWNYADTHTYWDVGRNRPTLHRVWHNSHYHEVGKTWFLYFRSGSPDLLRWARCSTDHYINVDTVNYADPNTPLKFHAPGAMYHCKGQTHWGSEAYGMERRDGHAGLWGHWTDPDASWWSWLLDHNRRGRDVYAMWHESVRKRGMPLGGTRREANTTLAIAVSAYQATHDADLLPYIHGMGRSLREDQPLEEQTPGPMWHPLWVNRYVELTRDPRYTPFVLEHGRKVVIKDTWIVALSALAYQQSGDKAFLTQHFDRLLEMPRHMYHPPESESDPYDWYGWGPGPLGSRWFWFGWPYFLRQLHAAGIDRITQQQQPEGGYPFTASRFNSPTTPPSLTVLALEDRDRPFSLSFTASSLGGDLHACSIHVYSPSGKEALVVENISGSGRSSATVSEPIGSDGEHGLYRIEMRGYEANIAGPVTDLPHEATVAAKGRSYRSRRVYAWVQPVNPADAAVTLTIASASDYGPCNYIVRNAAGDVVAEGSLFRPRPHQSDTITLDPAAGEGPWLIDIVGLNAVSFDGAFESILFAPNRQSLVDIGRRLGELQR